MGDLLKNILRQETETAQAAWELLKTLPDYNEAQQELERATEVIRAQVDFPTYEAWESAWLACCSYELRNLLCPGAGPSPGIHPGADAVRSAHRS